MIKNLKLHVDYFKNYIFTPSFRQTDDRAVNGWMNALGAVVSPQSAVFKGLSFRCDFPLGSFILFFWSGPYTYFKVFTNLSLDKSTCKQKFSSLLKNVLTYKPNKLRGKFDQTSNFKVHIISSPYFNNGTPTVFHLLRMSASCGTNCTERYYCKF